MAEQVHAAKTALLGLLSPEEKESRSFEDTARLIARDPFDSRSGRIGCALADYQDAINLFWLFAYEKGYHKRLASYWRGRRLHLVRELGLQDDEIESEVLWVLRKLITQIRGVPDPKGEKLKANLQTFSYMIVMARLDEWASVRAAPVKVPRSIRRTDVTHTWSVPFHQHFRNIGEPDALLTALEAMWSRDAEATLAWLLLCRDAECETKT